MKSPENKFYLYLVEGYRVNGKVKRRIIHKYGLLEELEKNEPDILNRLKLEAKNGTLKELEKQSITLSFNLNKQIGSNAFNYSHLLLKSIHDKFNLSPLFKSYSKCKKFDYDLDKILQLLVFQRIINPGSKLKTFKAQANMFGKWDLSTHDIYRSLDHFELLKEDIQLAIHDYIKDSIGRDAKLVMYDVTNYYFETDFDDEDLVDDNGEVIKKYLRKRGPSKEKRPNPIVQLGLFVDTNNIPIAYKLFPGNQTDPVTYLPAIEQVKKQFGLERIVTVADKGMNSTNNITQTNLNGDGYIFSQKVRGSRGVAKDIQTFATSKYGWKFNQSLTFGYKSTTRKRKLSNGKEIDEKMIVTWNQKYAIREQIRRSGAIEYAQKLTNSEKFRQAFKRGGKKYLIYEFIDEKTGEVTNLSPFIHIDKEKLAQDAMYDGLNVLITSEINRSDEEIIASYKELYKIEESFRVTKTDIKTRPIYVRLDNHIESHFLTCYLSLVVLRILQHKLDNEYSAAKIQEGLRSCIAIELGQKVYKVLANETMQQINKKLLIDWNTSIVAETKFKKYKIK